MNVPDVDGNILPPPTDEYLMRDVNEFGQTKMYKVLPTTDEKLMKVRYEKILRDVDHDSSGVISREEILKYIEDYRNGRDPEQRDTMVEEYLAYHDLDDSGDISKEEVWDSWEAWNIINSYAVLTHKGGLWNGGAF